MQEGCEFLVAESPDGRLDLADMYVTTDAPTKVGFVIGENPWAEAGEEAGSSSPGGIIDVSAEAAAGSYRRPEGLDELQLPAPREYHAVPWTSYWSGDTVKERAAKAWVRGWRGCRVAAEGCGRCSSVAGCYRPCCDRGRCCVVRWLQLAGAACKVAVAAVASADSCATRLFVPSAGLALLPGADC